MNYLFLGLLYDKDCGKSLLKYSKSGLQAAANQYQWGLIDGLETILRQEILIISSFPIGSFPSKNKKLFYSGYQKRLSQLKEIIYVGFLNFYLIREVCRSNNFNKVIKKNVEVNGQTTMFVYGLELAFISVLKRIKKKYKDKITIVLIVPDLPGNLGIQRNIFTLGGIWDRLFINGKMNMSLYADAFVLLTEDMKFPLKIRDKPYCIVEGFLPLEYGAINSELKTQKKIILYSGSLNLAFGIIELINAFKEINNNDYQLWICGMGDGESIVKEQSELNPNIIYFGFVDKKRVNELQQQATVLVNPRKNDGLYTMYSFPSKTLEYLASGKPTIMYKLPGIPEEYDKYLFYVDNDSIEALKNKIIEVCSKEEEELAQHGQFAKEWVQDKKNNVNQVMKIINMINSIGLHN